MLLIITGSRSFTIGLVLRKESVRQSSKGSWMDEHLKHLNQLKETN